MSHKQGVLLFSCSWASEKELGTSEPSFAKAFTAQGRGFARTEALRR